MTLKNRVSKQMSPKRRITLTFEGAKTEFRYFNDLKYSGMVSDNINLVPRKKGIGERNFSNPKTIASLLVDYVKYKQGQGFSTNLFSVMVINSIEEKYPRLIGYDDAGTFVKNVKREIMRQKAADDCKVLDEELALCISADYLKRSLNRDISIDIRDKPDPFNSNMPDSMYYLVVDRDDNSFTEEQVEEVVEICRDEGFQLIITNPCFELWLLLHFPVNKETLIKRATKCKNLKEELSRYSDINGLHYTTGRFLPFIADARVNLKEYEEGLDILRKPTAPETVGSNIGMLIDEIYPGGGT